MYANGDGVTQNYAEALRWLRAAAEQEDSSAPWGLGVMYRDGLGVPQDDGEALRWIRLAAEQGEAFAAEELKRLHL
jgi:TPR repeat protein